VGSLKGGIRAKVSNFLSTVFGFARNRGEHISVFVGSQTFTNASVKLGPIFYNKGKMSSIFQLQSSKDRWLHNGRGVVAVVEQSWGGNVVYTHTNGKMASLSMHATVGIPTAVPAAVGANMGISRGTNDHLQSSGVGVIGFTLFF
jgi:hypothetical protein